jgi:hypothetical protein
MVSILTITKDAYKCACTLKMITIKKYLKIIWSNTIVKKSIGVFLVIFGFIGIVTPMTPWGFLFFVGLEILGIRFLFIDRIKKKISNFNFLHKHAPKD